jgi:heterodisulfide reductase subunit C
MDTPNLLTGRDTAFIKQLEERSGQNLSRCYQCGNCTAGCPCSFVYDQPTARIMRFSQLGQKEKALNCRSLWLCLGCSTCSTRCPNDIDVALIMDTLRHMAWEEKKVTDRRMVTFWNTFLASVRMFGRTYELGLMAHYVLRTGRVFTDLDLVPRVLPKGKLAFVPHRIQGAKHVARIFKRFEEERKK